MYLFNDALNTFYLRLYGVGHMVKDHSDSERGNMGYSFRLAARVLLCAPFHRQDSTYHGLCYTSRGALAGTGNTPCKETRHLSSHFKALLKHAQFFPVFKQIILFPIYFQLF